MIESWQFVEANEIEELVKEERHSEALIILNKLLREKPNNELIISAKADVLFDIERYTEAIN